MTRSVRSISPRLVTLLAVAALAMTAVAPAAWSQAVTDGPVDDRAANGDGRAAIPGFYPVNEIPIASNQPGGMELDPATGYLWTSEDTSITIRDHAGNVVDSFGSAGSGDGQFSGAGGIAIDGDEVFIADGGNDRVSVFDTAGNHLRNISGGGLSPCAVEVVNDRVYLGNTSQVRINTRNGSFIDSFDGTDSGTAISTGCTLDWLASDGQEIFVGDFFNARVPVFDLDGNWLRSLAVGGNPSSIDTDNAGSVWFTDYSASTVERWSTAGAGTLLGQFDTAGSALGELMQPQGIVADPTGNTFWVAEQTNSRIQIFTDLDCDGQQLTHVGSAFSDVFDGTSGPDVVNLGKGFDIFDGGGDDDVICGGRGHDQINGGGGNDLIIGDNGNDVLLGGSGDDELDGKQGIDVINGNGGDDIVIGSNGFDELFGGGGNDLLRGAMGNDTVNGQGGADEVNGGQGIDTVRGGGGNDDVNGQNGDDSLNGGAGTDVCRGGNGTDTGFGCEDTLGIP